MQLSLLLLLSCSWTTNYFIVNIVVLLIAYFNVVEAGVALRCERLIALAIVVVGVAIVVVVNEFARGGVNAASAASTAMRDRYFYSRGLMTSLLLLLSTTFNAIIGNLRARLSVELRR
jgi:uncharacterized membrane protein